MKTYTKLFVKGRRIRVLKVVGLIEIVPHPDDPTLKQVTGKMVDVMTYTGTTDGYQSVPEIVEKYSLQEVIRMTIAGHFGGQEFSCPAGPKPINNRVRRWRREGFKPLGAAFGSMYDWEVVS